MARLFIIVLLVVVPFVGWGADTADTGVADTGVADTDVADTDVADTDASKPSKDAAPLKAEIPGDRVPTIRVELVPDSGAIGDLIEWRVIARHRVGDRVLLPASPSFGDLEIKGRRTEIADEEGDWVTEILAIQLISFETGAFSIAPQTITAVDADGNLSEFLTEPLSLTINSLIANEPEPQLKPDTGPGEVVYEEDYTLIYVAVVFVAIALVVLATLLVRKLLSLRKPGSLPPPPPPRPAEVIAREKLNALRSAPYLSEGKHKEFHLLLSEAFREYLGNRYHFDSLERSTEELISELQRQNISRDIFSELTALLNDTDLVKFAKFIPTIDDSTKALDEAFSLVDRTTLVESEASEKPIEDGD